MAADQTQALATVVVVTRDEYDLIDDFLLYYSAIFGAENVVVIDNGSTDVRLAPVYRCHREAGVRFVLERGPFVTAAEFMTEHMRALSAGCRYILPLETDEFIYLIPSSESTTVSIDEVRGKVLGHLRSLPDDVSVLRYGAFVGSCVDPSDAGYTGGAYSRPAAQITRFRDQGWDKLIVRAATFDRMTVWCHHAACTSGTTVESTLLGLLHFHDTGSRRRIERALPIVRSYRHIDLVRDTSAEQLREGRRTLPFGLACGHKLEYVVDHLARIETLRAFRRHLGRLPSSVEEMRRYSDPPAPGDVSPLLDAPTPDASVRRDIEAGLLSRGMGMAWDALLYAEERQDPEVEIRQVSHLLYAIRRSTAPRNQKKIGWSVVDNTSTQIGRQHFHTNSLLQSRLPPGV